VNAPPQVLLAHPGTQHAPRLAAELAERNALYRYWTGLAFAKDGLPYRLLSRGPKRVRALVAKRTLLRVSKRQMRSCPWLEVQTAIRRRAAVGSEHSFYLRNRDFQSRIAQREIERSDLVVGFDTSSWILAERCRRSGKPFVLDQSTVHPGTKERVFQRLQQRYPQWGQDFESKTTELIDLEKREHTLATRIVVASSFTKSSLVEEGICDGRISVIPYGVDLENFAPRPKRDADRPVRFLFVGLVNARKGIPLLLEVWERLHRCGAELWIVGLVENHVRNLIPDLPGLHILGKIAHSELPAIFRQCDVFVFPSFFEGFALVLLEAMACGLPIIATDATAAPDLIQHPDEGTIVEAGNAEMLYVAMRRMIDSPEKLERMSQSARSRAETFSWQSYGDRWIQLLEEHVRQGHAAAS
jgi:alpha-maltose-1-phosphate synthase